jgi:uncharacterized protein YjiS (DUF1127 family)
MRELQRLTSRQLNELGITRTEIPRLARAIARY